MNFTQYEQFLQKINEKFSEIRARNSSQMQCKSGCHSCCVPNLTIFALERDYIVHNIAKDPMLRNKLEELEKATPFQKTRCTFLSANGECAIYNFRPVVCRSHGVPIRFTGPKETNFVDVCPLNFKDIKAKDLRIEDILSGETVNSILSIMNRLHCGNDKGERFPLQLSAWET